MKGKEKGDERERTEKREKKGKRRGGITKGEKKLSKEKRES